MQLRVDAETVAQFTPGEARAFAETVFESAEAAESDAFFIEFLTKKAGVEAEAALVVLADFRNWREARAGIKATTPEDFAGPEYEKQREALGRE